MTTNDVSLRIRTFADADEADVIDLWQRCGLVVPWNDPKQDIERKRAFQPELFLVGLLDGQIVATVMAGYEGRRGWINMLGVDPQWQRRGLGRQIMAEAERRLQALGAPKVNLQVRASNLQVLHFYESLGYKDDHVVSLGKRLGDQ